MKITEYGVAEGYGWLPFLPYAPDFNGPIGITHCVRMRIWYHFSQRTIR